MITENLSTLKIHKLTQEQYDRELNAGRIDPSALYLTPDNGDSSVFVQNEEPFGVPDGSLWVDMDEDGTDDNDTANFVTQDELDEMVDALWEAHMVNIENIFSNEVAPAFNIIWNDYATKEEVNEVLAQAKSYIDETILGGAW